MFTDEINPRRHLLQLVDRVSEIADLVLDLFRDFASKAAWLNRHDGLLRCRLLGLRGVGVDQIDDRVEGEMVGVEVPERQANQHANGAPADRNQPKTPHS